MTAPVLPLACRIAITGAALDHDWQTRRIVRDGDTIEEAQECTRCGQWRTVTRRDAEVEAFTGAGRAAA